MAAVFMAAVFMAAVFMAAVDADDRRSPVRQIASMVCAAEAAKR